MDKSFKCKACDKKLKSFNILKNHIKTKNHKKNVISNYPETLVIKKINGIILLTNRIDITKISTYIIPIDKFSSSNFIKKRKSIKSINKDLYKKDSYTIDIDQAINLINKFCKYLQYNKIDPDSLFDYSYYLNNIDDHNTILDIYVDIQNIINDDYQLKELDIKITQN